MKNYFSNKALFVFVLALTAQFSAFADSKEISKARDFVSYCGTGYRYKSCDDIILTANIELTSDKTSPPKRKQANVIKGPGHTVGEKDNQTKAATRKTIKMKGSFI